MTLGKRAISGVLWGVVERIAVQGISFLVVMVLARVLTPADFGLVTIATTTILLGQTLLGETFSDALIQVEDLAIEHLSSIFWVLLAASLLAGLCLIMLAPLLATLFRQPDLPPILMALAPLLVLTALQAVPAAQFKRGLNFRAIVTASTFGTVIGGSIGLGAAFAGLGVWSLVANQLVLNALICASLWRATSFRPQFAFSRRHFAELWTFGRYTLLTRIAAFTANQGPRLLVGYLFGTAALGAFALGLRVTETLVQLIGLPPANVALSVIAQVRNDPERLKRAIRAPIDLAAMIAAPIFSGISVLTPLAVPILFGARWDSSIAVIQILALWGIVGCSGLIWISIIRGLGRPDIVFRTTLANAVAALLLIWLVAPWGFRLVALVFVARGYGTFIASPLILSRLTGIPLREQYRGLLPILLSALGMSAVLEGYITILAGSLTRSMLALSAIPIAALAYCAFLIVLAPSSLRLAWSTASHLRGGPGKSAFGEA